MRRRYFIVLLTVALCLGILAGCSGNGAGGNTATEEPVKASTKLDKPPNEKQILSDVNQSKYVELPSGSTFTSCEVIKRQSNTESKEDIVYCTFISESSFYRSEQQYRLLYNFYDEGGWILDEATPEHKDEWSEVYLDADGKDILESMIWLDAFTPELLHYADYIGEAGGIHYFAIPQNPNYTQNYQIYDHNGYLVDDWVIPEHSHITSVLQGKDSQPRFVLRSSIDDDSWMVNENGTILSDTYEWIYPNSTTPYTCIVISNDRYGAIDENGALVVPVEYETPTQFPGAPPAVKTPEYERVKTPDLPENVSLRNYSANGVFDVERTVTKSGSTESYPDVFNGKGESVLALEYEAAAFDSRTDLMMVFPTLSQEFDPRDPYQLYDLNGNCRSPEFARVGRSTYGTDIVSYQGRCGLLPQILTSEESEYFSYLWGMEHR